MPPFSVRDGAEDSESVGTRSSGDIGAMMRPIPHSSQPTPCAHPLAAQYAQLPQFRSGNTAASAAVTAAQDRKDRFEETMADVTREYDSALMAESTKCKHLEDELVLLREDLHLERAANADLRSEIREHQRQNALLQQERSVSYGSIATMATAKDFIEQDHQQLLHEVQILRESEGRLQSRVRQLQDENDELRRYWESTYSRTKADRIQSVTPEMLERRSRVFADARARRNEKTLRAEMHRATEAFAEAQHTNVKQLEYMAGALENTRDELVAAKVQGSRLMIVVTICPALSFLAELTRSCMCSYHHLLLGKGLPPRGTTTGSLDHFVPRGATGRS